MQSVVLKGTKDGYELILKETASIRDILVDLKQLLEDLSEESKKSSNKLSLNVQLGNRLMSDIAKNDIIKLVDEFDNLEIGSFLTNVITKEESQKIMAKNNVDVMSRTIRNGQEVNVEGDVLFFGKIHEGGKLFATGNIYNMGIVEGIVQAGFPDDESKLIIGNLHTAQQVRVGEQYDIVSDKPIEDSEKTVVYVNDLHVLSYGKIKNLKEINPKFFNRIGGIE
ncbi:septum site-determining protein MinC [Apilactobacillus apinorum]|uniref:septum site-determining protein MinC n=1 Tax=Apilactobacillus apinorum TaxID=1218495 RepID=UPI0006B66C9B|nr:septum site-determining protein MinC [Apilactobacillus apinorum]KOY69118.1 Septum site-determining protein MinC [Apilactobacillus apinorum]CAI2650078.1 Septum site-determining protein MinC [Apilactobacillus apinorum]